MLIGGKMKSKSLLKLLGAIGLAVLIVIPLTVGCAAPAPVPAAYEEYVAGLPEGCEPVPQECFEQAIEEGELCLFDWCEWWPEEVYKNFEEEFGIKLTRDYFDSEDELVAKFRLHPEAPFDYALPDTGAFVRMKELGVLSELNHDWIPNVNKFYPEYAKEVWYNPDYKWGVNYETGITAYMYNTKYVDDPRLPSWSVLFEPAEEYKGKVSMLNEMNEVIGCALRYLGYSFTSDDEEELMEAKELLLKQKPHVVAYDSAPRRLCVNEEAWIVHHYAGDTWFYHSELVESLMMVIPTEGSLLAEDILVIPKGVRHPAAAHLWINYLYRPNVGAAVTNTVGWCNTNPEAFQFFSEELKKWPSMNIPEEYLANCDHVEARMLTGKGLELRSAIWEELKM